MKVKKYVFTLFTFFTIAIISSLNAQVLNDCETTDGWNTGAGGGMTSEAVLSSDFDDFAEGNASMKVSVTHVGDTARENWTDINYLFASPVDITGATDVRFKVKVLRPTTFSRAFQFTFDLFDQPAGATGLETQRLGEDWEIFTVANNTEWYEVVIPLSKLRVPHWATPANAQLDKESIVGLAFGIHTRGAADTLEFLIDDFRATTFDYDNEDIIDPSVEWTTFNNNNPGAVVSVNYNFDDFLTGNESVEAKFEMIAPEAAWGSVAYVDYVFPQKLDISGATEFRFWMKILDGAILKADSGWSYPLTNQIAFLDLWDEPEGASGQEFWRYRDAGHFSWALDEILHLKRRSADNAYGDPQWIEYVVPLDYFSHPSWDAGINGQFDPSDVVRLSFGVGHRNLEGVADTIHILLDNFSATVSKDNVVGVDDNDFLPTKLSLDQNYPNPFNPSTTIKFQVPNTGNVDLKIYNISGQEVRTVIDNAYKPAGNYEFNVDMSEFSSGVYFYELRFNNQIYTKKMLLMK